MLHAYHQGYDWTDSIHRGIVSALEEDNIELFVEHMDTKRHYCDEYYDFLETLYFCRYVESGIHFDAIVCSDDNALNFLLDRRDRLFPGVPIVFCGINRFTPERIAGHEGITGVNEDISMRATIDLALRLRPNARRLGVITDDVVTGRLHRKSAEQAVPFFEDRVEFVWLTNMEPEDIKTAVATFNEQDIILFLSYFVSPSGDAYPITEIAQMVSEASPAPVFSLWDFMMGSGTLGGEMLSGEEQGATAGRLAHRVLSGEDVSTIDPVLESPNMFMFDYRLLQRFGITQSELPEDSVIMFEPPQSMWQKYKLWIIFALSFILLEALLILRLIIGRHRRIQLEHSLRASEEYNRVLFENIRDAVIVVNTDRLIQYVNPATGELFGYDVSALIGQSARMLYSNDFEYEKIGKAMIFSGGVTARLIEARFSKKSGLVFDGEVHFSELLDGGGVSVGYLGSFRDISERKRAENHRFEMERQIQQTQRLESLGVLAGGIAHDFNNILMAVLGYAELALEQISPVSPVRHNLQEITIAAHRAAELCRQMLAYSGKSTFMMERTSLAELIEEIAHLLKMSISKKAVLNMHLEHNLPDIMADASQIRQVIMNLIINASEAIGDRSGVITIHAGATRCDYDYLRKTELSNDLVPGLYIHIEVIDTGCGMDVTTQARIFEPFFSTKFTGRGLGLAAVMGIIRSHKGALKVYSEPGKGTTFKILFAALETLSTANDKREHEIPSTWRGSGTILLADDEESLRAMGAEIMENLGFSVITACDGQEAVEVFTQHKDDIDVAMLDLTMPHLDGTQVFSELRRINPELPIIIASGYSKEDIASRFVGKGLTGVLQKPFTMKSLRDVLQQAMDP
ncbi:MAG: response regulator [Candidatus Cloacimonetes bacterium]|nr:response regulator [Candidatus Cloacimonadota bacterium]